MMKNNLLPLLLLFFLPVTTFSADKKNTKKQSKFNFSNSRSYDTSISLKKEERERKIYEYQDRISKLVSKKESEIDIALDSLALAKEVFPDLDIAFYDKKINQIVNDIKKLIGNEDDPDYHIRAINTYLFKKLKIEYDLSDPFGFKPENRYLIGPIDRKKGNCVSLPVLYIAIAQRLGFPVYAVTAPDHLFARYTHPKLKMQNIEPTGRGGYSPDEKYIKDLKIPVKSIKSGAYLKTLTHKEFLGELIAQNAIYHAQMGDEDRALFYFNIARKLNPTTPEIYEAMAKIHFKKSREGIIDAQSFAGTPHYNEMRQINMQTKRHHVTVANSYVREVNRLGIVKLSRIEYAKRILGKFYKKEYKNMKKLIEQGIPKRVNRQGNVLD